jgi:light-regulated signal transduction histidine kinase (bacteriophytochrome)
MRIITPANKVKIISASGRVLKDEHGNVVKMVGSVLDITGQKQIETDLKKTVAELYRSNKELEEFAYVASHDLHEPLRKITTFSEKLFDECNHLLTEEGRHYLDRIKYSADNMTKLIDNLLEFSLLNQYSDPYGQESLNTVLKEVLEDLDLLIEETGATLQVGGLPELECSHSQMKQLFANLINNAIKFRKNDVPVVVKISSEVLNDEEKAALYLNPTVKYYKIVLSDNGIGFKQEYADVIFQIFKRLYGRSTYAGSGIGLAICKKICDHHKGVIFAEGEPSVGAKFIVVLPEKQEM